MVQGYKARGSNESGKDANDKLHNGKARRLKVRSVPVVRGVVVDVAKDRGGLFRDKRKRVKRSRRAIAFRMMSIV